MPHGFKQDLSMFLIFLASCTPFNSSFYRVHPVLLPFRNTSFGTRYVMHVTCNSQCSLRICSKGMDPLVCFFWLHAACLLSCFHSNQGRMCISFRFARFVVRAPMFICFSIVSYAYACVFFWGREQACLQDSGALEHRVHVIQIAKLCVRGSVSSFVIICASQLWRIQRRTDTHGQNQKSTRCTHSNLPHTHTHAHAHARTHTHAHTHTQSNLQLPDLYIKAQPTWTTGLQVNL